MAKTYAQISKEIEALQSEADRIKNREMAEVIGKIKDAIETYGLSEQDLFAGSRKGPATKSAAKKKARRGGAPKYSDGGGNSWGGMGPRPRWLRDALESGKKLDDFLAGNTSKTPAARQEDRDGASELAPTQAPEGTSGKKPAAKKAAAKKRSAPRASEADPRA